LYMSIRIVLLLSLVLFAHFLYNRNLFKEYYQYNQQDKIFTEFPY